MAKGSIGRALLVAISLMFVVTGGLVYCGVTRSWKAEKRLHAINLTLVVVTVFIKQEKRWPNSWDDLRKVATVKVASMYSWPKDISIIQNLILIDFDIEIGVIASQEIDSFRAVVPDGPCYPYQDYGYVKSLISAAQQLGANKGQRTRKGDSHQNW